MRERKIAVGIIILNIFSLNVSFSQDLYQSLRNSGPNPNIDEIKKQTYDADRIKRVNELSDTARRANPPAQSKITIHKSPNSDTSPDDDGDKPGGGKAAADQKSEDAKSASSNGVKKTFLDDTRTGGYRKNAKGPESTPAPSSIKVRTDDTPEELNFPGTND